MKEPWINFADITTKLEKIETNPQLVQITSPTEMVILATFEILVDDVTDLINICIPYVVLEPIIPRLCKKIWFNQNTDIESNNIKENIIIEKIFNTSLELSAELGRTSVLFDELSNLQIGDVIPLKNNVQSEITVYLGDLLMFTGKSGIYNNKYSVKITDVIKKEK